MVSEARLDGRQPTGAISDIRAISTLVSGMFMRSKIATALSAHSGRTSQVTTSWPGSISGVREM